MSPASAPSPHLPAGFVAERELTRGGSGRVFLARRAGRRVVVRLAPPDASAAARGGEAQAELAALAGLSHPGLAALADHGTLEDGTAWTARAWIEGQDLAAWWRAQRSRSTPADAEQRLGTLVVALCAALDHLHARDLVHGDLKPENVLVQDDGAPVLADFGFASARGAERGAAGTPFYAAPEVLCGAVASPAIDLFALGAMLVRLLVARELRAADLYARFPGIPFFAALELSAEDLPAWARDVAESLVARDPARRPASAAAVGRAIAGRLGLAWHAPARPDLRFPLLEGRASWLSPWIASLADRHGPQGVRVDAGEDVAAIAEALRLEAAVAGVRTRVLPAERLAGLEPGSQALDALARELAGPSSVRDGGSSVRDRDSGVRDGDSSDSGGGSSDCDGGSSDSDSSVRDGDASLRDRDSSVRDGDTSLRDGDSDDRDGDSSVRGDAARRRAVAFLALGADPIDAARAAHVARAFRLARAPLVVVTVAAGSLADCDVVELPPVERAHVQAFVARSIDAGSAARVTALARALHPAPGPARSIAARLARAIECGWILAGDGRARLRAGSPPAASDLAPELAGSAALEPDTVRLAAATSVLGGAASLSSVAALAGLEPARALAARPAWIRLVHGRDLVLDADARTLVLDPALLRDLHARRARELERSGSGPQAGLAHRFAADGGGSALGAVVEAAQDLRESGRPGLALELARRAAAAARGAGRAEEPRLAAEIALAWIRLGEPERARAELDLDAQGGGDAAQAARHLVRSALHAAAGAADAALAEARAAAALDPSHADARADLEARALFEAGRDVELEELVAQTSAGARTRANARNLLAASLQRRGQVERARSLFTELIEEARRRGDGAREAALAQNLGTLERRAGHASAARALFERAAALHEHGGAVAGLAHARTQLGGMLREQGELLAAAAPLESAADLADRLGDAAGAAVARGTHGLLLAERGHVHAARTALERAAADLLALGRRSHAALLEARLEVLAARTGRPPGAVERARQRGDAGLLDADPRALVALARAAWMRHDARRALERADRAAALAGSLGQGATAAEAAALARRARASDATATEAVGASRAAPAGAGTDERVLSALRDPLPLAEAQDLARDLEARGCDDRAARVWCAIAARARDPRARQPARARAAALFATCARGSTPAEAAVLARHLLARPDPRPGDLGVLGPDGSEDEELEMDVVRLLEINQRLVDEQELDKLLGTIVESALSMTGAERGFLVLEEDGRLVFDTALDSKRGGIAAPELEISRSVVQQALDRGVPLVLSNASEDPELGAAPSVASLDLRSILCVPFAIDARSRGVVYVDHRVRAGAFGPRSERLLALLAGQAALAIRQVRRLDEIRRLNLELEHEVAHTESDLRTAQAALVSAGMPGVVSGLVGRSPSIRRVHDLVARFAPVGMPVMVVGPSGTGKELAARALHVESPRASGPFVVENCAALPASLVEAELFGAARGAFTGAEVERAGLFERAHGGTLFLDEIGELPLELQAKLLRVLETGEVRRLGEGLVRHVDFRLVAATNRDLEAEVRAGRFRQDLYYRLDGLRITMPPLSERVEDVPLLVEHFLRLEGARGGGTRRATPDVVAALSRRAWPGNVRELRNEVARLLVLCPGDLDDPSLVRPPSDVAREADGAEMPVVPLVEMERRAIERAIAVCGGDKTRAADMLGISRAKIYQRVKEWNAAP